MPNKLRWDTVTPLLQDVLIQIMANSLFDPFRLVEGTSLSLRFGHRMSDDIDLFSDAAYGSLDFDAIEQFLRHQFVFVHRPFSGTIGMGSSYHIGPNEKEVVKLDLYHTEQFIRNAVDIQNIRLAGIDDIVAMKMDIIQRIGRKKDFWDLHLLLAEYSIGQMIQLHEERFPYSHDELSLRANFVRFERADDAPDPLCLMGKHWELIKYDFMNILAAA